MRACVCLGMLVFYDYAFYTARKTWTDVPRDMGCAEDIDYRRRRELYMFLGFSSLVNVYDNTWYLFIKAVSIAPLQVHY